MKILGLLRHAKSDWGQSDKRDFDRGLNDRGRRGARVIGDHIRAHGVDWDRLVASPAERVKQTLAAALPALAPRLVPCRPLRVFAGGPLHRRDDLPGHVFLFHDGAVASASQDLTARVVFGGLRASLPGLLVLRD